MNILIKDGARYSLRQWIKDNPGVMYPAKPSSTFWARQGAYYATRTPQPDYDQHAERLVEGFSETSPGAWEQTWTKTPLTDEEKLDRIPWKNYTEANAAMVEWIDGLTDQVEATYPSVVKKRWPEEEAAARAVLAGTATQAQTDLMTAEAAAKGRNAEDHSTIIIGHADRFRTIVTEVNKLFLATDAQLAAAASPLEYPAIFEWAQEQAAPLAQAYGLEV